MDIIDQFHTDDEKYIFLISTLAGGTGLNLTCANKVVIFDPNWSKSCGAVINFAVYSPLVFRPGARSPSHGQGIPVRPDEGRRCIPPSRGRLRGRTHIRTANLQTTADGHCIRRERATTVLQRCSGRQLEAGRALWPRKYLHPP